MGLQGSKHSTPSKPPTAPRRTGLFCQRPEEPRGALFLQVSRLSDDGTEQPGSLRNSAFVVQEDLNVDSFIVYSLHRVHGRLTFFTGQTRVNPRTDKDVVVIEMVTRLRGEDLRDVDEILRGVDPGPCSEEWARSGLDEMRKNALMVNKEVMAAHGLLRKAVQQIS